MFPFYSSIIIIRYTEKLSWTIFFFFCVCVWCIIYLCGCFYILYSSSYVRVVRICLSLSIYVAVKKSLYKSWSSNFILQTWNMYTKLFILYIFYYYHVSILQLPTRCRPLINKMTLTKNNIIIIYYYYYYNIFYYFHYFHYFHYILILNK